MNDTDRTLRIGSLCSGYGGLDMAAQSVFGGRLEWVADNDPSAAAVLSYRYPDLLNLGDVTKIDWNSVPSIDVLTAGYPCQPFSVAGKRKGEEDSRNIWPCIKRAISHLRPKVIVLENVRNHLRLGFARVLGDLTEVGYDARWTVVRASDVGAPHQRARLVIVANPQSVGRSEWRTESEGKQGGSCPSGGSGAATTHPDSQPECQWWESRSHQAEGWGSWSPASGRRRMEIDDGDPQIEPSRAGVTGWGSGEYDAAIRRWEGRFRLAPPPTEPTGRGGAERLSPAFAEWMMGLPAGWVTDVPGLTRSDKLKIIGNGVVPQQVAYGVDLLCRQLSDGRDAA